MLLGLALWGVCVLCVMFMCDVHVACASCVCTCGSCVWMYIVCMMNVMSGVYVVCVNMQYVVRVCSVYVMCMCCVYKCGVCMHVWCVCVHMVDGMCVYDVCAVLCYVCGVVYACKCDMCIYVWHACGMCAQ